MEQGLRQNFPSILPLVNSFIQRRETGGPYRARTRGGGRCRVSFVEHHLDFSVTAPLCDSQGASL